MTFFLSPGQMSHARGALVLLAEMPRAKRLIGDKGYDADWLRDELKAQGIRVCIPARTGRNRPATHNTTYRPPSPLDRSAANKRWAA